MGEADRRRRTARADALCLAAYDAHGGPASGVAMVAVGGYGRGELAPHSDLDVVLVHADGTDPGRLAEEVWYPLWDAGVRLDHSVRTFSGTVGTAGDDLRVALGLLDARHVAGDPGLTLQLRTALLAAWRREARRRLPELRALVERRHALMGELAHASVPDLKESAGGLRDATVLRALVATWLVDVPHADLERARRGLLDVRDQAHEVAGRGVDRIGPELWPALADGLGLHDAVAAQVQVRRLGRRVTHVSRLTWRRVDAVLDRPPSVRRARTPDLRRIGGGLATARDEVVLDAGVRAGDDPVLLLRAATEAAERGSVLAPATVVRLLRESPALPEPWPTEARRLLARLLASGTGLLPVWETLDETGALAGLLPEWEAIRSLPHASVVHRFTVDRHSVEACMEASALIRRVARPDLLVLAALLHDIGKGHRGDHSIAGAPVARAVALRTGFSEPDADLVARLVRHHLLLGSTATSRDLDDPATIAHVAARVGDRDTLDLLVALAEADARATSPKAWSTWRSGLVHRLVARVAVALEGAAPGGGRVPDPAALPVPARVRQDPSVVAITVEPTHGGARVTVLSGDRIGLLADAAALLALQRTTVRAARAWTQGEIGVSVWDVPETGLDHALLTQRMARITAGDAEVRSRLALPADAPEPVVVVRPDASRTATVLEVRADDSPGVVHLVCAALAALDLTVRSAHVDTLGPQAVAVFYVQELAAAALSDERSAAAAHALRNALSPSSVSQVHL